MTTPQRLERDLPTILGELALAPYPDYVDGVLATTAQRRQRPRWTFPERWLPMDLVTQRVPTPALPWRALGVLALIAILIGAAIAVYVGSQPRLPDPFGPAANGVVSYESGGTIYLFDPATDTTRALGADAQGWRDPWFSPDGRSLLLAREVSGGKVEFGVLPVDGDEIRLITPEPLLSVDWIEWSPGSDALIASALVKHPRGSINVLLPGIVIIDVETGTVSHVPTGPSPSYATYLPPEGDRILVVSASDTTVTTMNLDTSEATTILQTEGGSRIIGRPNVSPDGTTMAYGIWHPDGQRVVLHMLDLVSGADRRVADDPAIEFTAWPRFSPDGRTLSVELKEGRGGLSDETRLAFIHVASGVVTPTGLDLTQGAALEWSPDGTVLVASVNGDDDQMQPHVLVDPVTGRVTPAPWTAVSYPSWQRTAPVTVP
jgi:dipeptidyl aminopeptidase/acylaminoacyl peptidase